MAQIEVLSEQAQPRGWSFEIQILDDAGRLRRCTVHLAWADYNLWSADGSDPPARLAEAVVTFLLRHQPATDLPDRLDASICRRLYDDADSEIPRLV